MNLALPYTESTLFSELSSNNTLFSELSCNRTLKVHCSVNLAPPQALKVQYSATGVACVQLSECYGKLAPAA